MFFLVLLAGLCHAANLNSADLFEVLGVSPVADTREIRVAFKREVLKHHPEANPGSADAHSNMMNLLRAYTVLSDYDQRHVYETHGGLSALTDLPKEFKFEKLEYYEGWGIFDEEEDVEVFNYHSWSATTVSTDAWYIIFYTSQFAHSDDFAQDWTRVARRLKDAVHVGAVDCDDDNSFAICHNLGIFNLPTVILYPSGQFNGEQSPYLFKSEHNYDNYVEFALLYQPPLVAALSTRHFPSTYRRPFIPKNETSKEDLHGSRWLIGTCLSQGVEGCGDLRLKLKEIALILKSMLPVGQIECGTNDADRSLCDAFGVPRPALQRDDSVTDTSASDSLLFYVDGTNQLQIEINIGYDARAIARKIIDRLPPIELVSIQDLEEASAVLVADPAHRLLHTSRGSGKHFLVLFQSEVHCQTVADIQSGVSPPLSPCERTQLAFRLVSMILSQDPNYNQEPLHTVLFDCHAPSDRARREDLCTRLQVQSLAFGADRYRPEIAMLKDQALSLHRFHGQTDRSDLINWFIQETYKSSVHELGHEDFEHHIQQEGQAWFVDFYTPWCAECRRVFPAMNDLAVRDPLSTKVDIHYAKVNCGVHPDLCKDNHVHRYPTFLFFVNGTRHQFEYDYTTADEMARFITDSLHPLLYEFTPTTFKEIIFDPDQKRVGPHVNNEESHDGTEGWILDFFAPWCSHCHKMNPIFEAAADTVKGVMKFGKLNCELEKGFCKSLHIRQYPTIFRYASERSRRERPVAEFTAYNDYDAHKILEFAVAGLENFVEEIDAIKFTEEVQRDDTPSEAWFVFYYTDKGRCDRCDEIAIQLKAVASRYRYAETAKFKAAEERGQLQEYHNFPAARVNFGKVNCRGSGATLCLEKKIKKHPTLVYYSGESKQETRMPKTVTSAVGLLNFVREKADEDRRQLHDPLRTTEEVKESTVFTQNLQDGASRYFRIKDEL